MTDRDSSASDPENVSPITFASGVARRRTASDEEREERRIARRAERGADREDDADAREERRAARRAERDAAREAEPIGEDETKGGKRKKGGKKKRSGKRNKADDDRVVEVAPMAAPARMRRRHWGVLLSFVLIVLVPTTLVGAYLWTTARDQYASTAGFTVRQEEGGAATELLTGFAAQLSSGSAGSDAGILYEYIQSQAMLQAIESEVGLVEHYAQYWDEDPVFSIWPDPTIEELLWYWSRIVRVSYDQTSGQVELRVLAFDPDKAVRIGQAILRESQRLVNELNATAREDASRFAREDLDEALARLKKAREALTLFRTRTQIVDPETDLAGRMAVVNTLQAQLAQALVDLDILRERTSATDPRVDQSERQIAVIRERIAAERAAVAAGQDDIDGDDYPTLLAEYEGLVVDREFAEESYRAALSALDISRTNASRQTRYLATYISPTRPQSAEYPRRSVLLALTALFLILGWSILVLIYYSVRDSR
ncbi:sugar transporter [uncultured Jannaschia sp.]|uniref:sugar transporter n=1 Tax=uncultured Jannaschia sp. TaxID=293347 RepID=UPI002609CD03|nr:sugar transporter [uncultured Jannaschia sp.]